MEEAETGPRSRQHMAQFASCRGRNGRGPAFFCDIDLGVRTTSASGCAGGLVGMALIRL